MKGIVCIDKPKGMTSSDVVVKVRNILSRTVGEKQKAGHFGTLDPDGQGVLIVGIGTANRLFDYVLKKDKTYRAAFCFGKETDTLDESGTVTATDNVEISKDDVIAVLPRFKGRLMQIPPQYSALSVNGVKAYKLARKGVEAPLQAREIEIYSIELVEQISVNVFEFRINCSSGTYIRSIARDMAKALNTLGYMKYIIREKSGSVELKDCVTLSDFEKEPVKYVQSFEKILPLKKYALTDVLAQKALSGLTLDASDDMPSGDFYLESNGEIKAVAEARQGKLVLKTRL